MNTITLEKKVKKVDLLKFMVLLGLLMFSSTIVFGQIDVNTEIRRSLATAKAAYGMGEYQDALDEYLNISKLAPDFSDIYKAIGDAYEKIGGEDNLDKAIENYKHYLLLSPNAEDKDAVQDKIFQLEYYFKKEVQKTKILDDLTGYWVSNLILNHPKKNIPVPFVILKVQEIQKTGKYRVTIIPECGLYSESIIDQTVNIIPDKDNSLRFTFADAKTHRPSGAGYDFLRFASSAILGNDLVGQAVQSGINAAQEKDLPSNTKTAYDFQLKYNDDYNDGILEGLFSIVQRFSNSDKNKTTQDSYGEIYFTKQCLTLGLSGRDMNEPIALRIKSKIKEGVYVTFVDTEKKISGEEKSKKELTAAFNAGITPGDIITEINDFKISSVEDMQELMSSYRLGDNVVVKGFRGNSKKTFKFQLKDLAPVRQGVDVGIWVLEVDKKLIEKMSSKMKKEKDFNLKNFKFSTNKGVFVNSVSGNAKEAGIRRGDIIIEMGGIKISDCAGYYKELLKYQKDGVIAIKINRNGQEDEFEVSL